MEPRLAATVVVLREQAAAPEVLLVKRARGASFMGDAFVFPGGRVDPDDAGADVVARARAGAARELREEASVTVDAATMIPFSHWVTPASEPKRFDTYFFLAVVPAGTRARVDEAEVVELLWEPAAALLARHQRGGMKLPPPTLSTLMKLSQLGDVDAIRAWATGRPLDPIRPKLLSAGRELTVVLPWDPGYASELGEGEPIAADHRLADGPSRFVLRGGRFWGETAPR